jgi:phosphotriesterase-related protein
MTTVQTVLGPVDAADLGPTLVHEHVRISYPGDALDPAYSWDRSACIDTGVERMAGLAEHGVRTFVDPCPIDLGRDPELMAEVARQSGMQIVCSTGFYLEHIGIPYYWRVRSAEEVAEFYLHEIEHGIGDTGIKPGCIKIASGDPPGDHDRKIVAAAAMAAAASGLTVISHCENSNGGDVQQEILATHGANLSRSLIGHQGQSTDMDYIRGIAERGSFVGYDRCGYEILAPDDQRADQIMALVEAGHADKVCLSQDHMCCMASPKFPYPIPEGFEEVFDQMLPTVYDQMFQRPHTFLFTDFWPKLESRGMDRAMFDSMLTDNPRRLFGG